ncbi:unnamed protein product [Caenorhabditis angaria]|uniref:TrmE-type G domain-containing protein n=1 Tax=Caenorhabditis angaria TaxID=860376 RepID=A0A9P1I6Z1_9PELO|nr:unnamed protein product [Caenorhabditis angaria]
MDEQAINLFYWCWRIGSTGPKTFTGEDTAEIFIHGSTAIAGKLAETLAKIDNVREAKRGEFSRRAFYNGKMDLAQVQGLNSLIRSRSEKERKIAFGQMRGGEKAIEIRSQLKHVISQLYVIMDFGEHVELKIEEARKNILEILKTCRILKNAWKMAEKTQRGLNIVLYGKPNSGKSSILNKLAHDDVAIVSPIAGTTRDSIDKVVEISGVRCRLTDTAGIRDETSTEDIIELEGIRRAKQSFQEFCYVLELWRSYK